LPEKWKSRPPAPSSRSRVAIDLVSWAKAPQEDRDLYSVRDKIHRDSVDAVAQMGRWRTVVKDVAKMASAIRAMNLGSHHPEASINGCLVGTLDRIVEAGPSGPAFELLL
jgi:hypothetical protein